MSLTKPHIVTQVSEANGFLKKRSSEIVETLLEIVKRTIASGDDVLISGFGKFCVKEKNQRLGRNPSTGSSMILDSRKVVTFKCSGSLRDVLND